MPKPDCYRCIHRRSMPGSAHSRCEHPTATAGKMANDPLAGLFSIRGTAICSFAKCSADVSDSDVTEVRAE